MSEKIENGVEAHYTKDTKKEIPLPESESGEDEKKEGKKENIDVLLSRARREQEAQMGPEDRIRRAEEMLSFLEKKFEAEKEKIEESLDNSERLINDPELNNKVKVLKTQAEQECVRELFGIISLGLDKNKVAETEKAKKELDEKREKIIEGIRRVYLDQVSPLFVNLIKPVNFPTVTDEQFAFLDHSYLNESPLRWGIKEDDSIMEKVKQILQQKEALRSEIIDYIRNTREHCVKLLNDTEKIFWLKGEKYLPQHQLQ